MSITFACEHCGKSFTIDDKFGGKKGKCKQCGIVMAIPEKSRSASSSAHGELEPATSRRSSASAEAPRGDVYGFEDRPSPTIAGLPTGIEEVGIGSHVASRVKSQSPGRFDPPKKKKKGSVGGVIGLILKVVFGLFGAIMGVGLVSVVFQNMAGISSKGTLEVSLQERITLNEELASMLTGVNDVPGAKSASPVANQKVKAISANLRKLKLAKGRKADLDTLKQKYLIPQEKASQNVVQQMLRIATIAGAWDALDVQASLEELGREENSIPGMNKVQVPDIPAPVMPMPPPVGDLTPPPVTNRPANNRNKSKGKGLNRPVPVVPD